MAQLFTKEGYARNRSMGRKSSPKPMGNGTQIIATWSEPDKLERKGSPDTEELYAENEEEISVRDQTRNNTGKSKKDSGRQNNKSKSTGSGNSRKKKREPRPYTRMLAIGVVCFLVAAGLLSCASIIRNSSLVKSRELYNNAEEMAREGNYIEALAILDSIEETSLNRSAVRSLRQEINSAYRHQIIEEADSAANRGDYREAVDILSEGIDFFQGDSTLEEERAKYLPVDLTALEPAYQGAVELINYEITDTYGDVYYTGIRGYMEEDYEDSYVIWALNGDYKKLSARVIVRQEDRESEYTGAIRIYGDGTLLFERNNIDSSTPPYDIEIDVENVRELRVEMTGDGNMGLYGINSVLVNTLLHKW